MPCTFYIQHRASKLLFNKSQNEGHEILQPSQCELPFYLNGEDYDSTKAWTVLWTHEIFIPVHKGKSSPNSNHSPSCSVVVTL